MRQLVIIIPLLLAGQLYGVSHFYDPADRLIRSVQHNGTTTLYSYDDANNLLSVTPQQAPGRPQGVSAQLGGTTTATVTWEDNADDESGYRIQRRRADGYDWSTRAEVPPNTTSFIDTGLNPNASYVYRVLALGTGGLTSAYSAEVAAAGDESEPFNIRAFRANGPRLELEFESISGADYRMEVSGTLETGSWTEKTFSITPLGAETSATVTGTGNPLILYFDPAGVRSAFYRLVRE